MTLEELITALEQQAHIRTAHANLRLKLPREPIGPDVATRLARAIAGDPRFTNVSFQGCTLDDISLENLLTELTPHPNLKALDLSMTSLTDTCASTLALLASFKTLYALDLSGNSNLGDKVADALLTLLQQPNAQLTQVHLGGTGISHERCEAIQTIVTQHAERLHTLTTTTFVPPSSSSSPGLQSAEPSSHQPPSTEPAPQQPQSLLARALAEQPRPSSINCADSSDESPTLAAIHEREEATITEALLAMEDTSPMPTERERPLSVWSSTLNKLVDATQPMALLAMEDASPIPTEQESPLPVRSPTLNKLVDATQPTALSTTTGGHRDPRDKAAARSTNSVTQHGVTATAKRLNSSPADLQYSTSVSTTSSAPNPDKLTFLKTLFTSWLSPNAEPPTTQKKATQIPIPLSPPSSSRQDQERSSETPAYASSNTTAPLPLEQSPTNTHAFMRRTDRLQGSSSIFFSADLSALSSPILPFAGQQAPQGSDQGQITETERDIYLRELKHTFDDYQTNSHEKIFILPLIKKAERGDDVSHYYEHTLSIMKTAAATLKPSRYPAVFKCLNQILTQFLNPKLPHTEFIANQLEAWRTENKPMYGASAGARLFENEEDLVEQYIFNMLMYLKENPRLSLESCATYLDARYTSALTKGIMTERHGLAKILLILSQDMRSKADTEKYLLEIEKLIPTATPTLS